MNLRIAVSGPPGSGKSALVNALAHRLNLPSVPESMKEIVQSEKTYRTYKTQPGFDPKKLEEAHRLVMSSYKAWFDDRVSIYARLNDGFVADRWEADLLDTWLIKHGLTSLDSISRVFFDHMISQSKSLTAVVMLPFLPPFDTTHNDDGLTRAHGFSARLVKQAMTRGLMQLCPSLRVIEMPAKPWSVDQRVDKLLPILMSL